MANNLTSKVPSINAALNASASYGALRQMLCFRVGTATVAATAASGGVTLKTMGFYTVPTVGTGVAGYCISTTPFITDDAGSIMVAGLSYTLGTLTVSTNSFSAGSSMPTKTVAGGSITTAASMVIIDCSVSVTATTPVLTITYTNEAGVGSRTATLTLPTNPTVSTGFYVSPHLQSGDTGMRAITNMSISTGSAGTIIAYGVLPIGVSINGANGGYGTDDLVSMTKPIYLCEAGESIGFWRAGISGSGDVYTMITGIPEPS